jgi:hypothetical protein
MPHFCPRSASLQFARGPEECFSDWRIGSGKLAADSIHLVGMHALGKGLRENLHLVERWTRTGPRTLAYEVRKTPRALIRLPAGSENA